MQSHWVYVLIKSLWLQNVYEMGRRKDTLLGAISLGICVDQKSMAAKLVRNRKKQRYLFRWLVYTKI